MRTPNNERLTPDIVEATRSRSRAEPERRCILSGEVAARDDLVRLAIAPDGLVLPDAHEKAPGRGAWFGGTRDELVAAIEKGRLKGALARAFKGAPLAIPEDLPQRTEEALRRAFLDRLGLEMRVGALILGTQRIAETARAGGIDLLLHASDASEDGRRKLDQAWRVGRDAEGSGERGFNLPLDRGALSVALGRDNVVHLGVSGDAAAGRVIRPLARLMHFIGQDLPGNDGRGPAGARADTAN